MTGGSAGIGLATAERFAEAGWNVAIIARDEVRLKEAETKLEAHGGAVLAISADVAGAKAVDAAAAQVIAQFGRIDAWVNNAMSTVVAKADEITPEEYQRVTATTYFSQVYGTLAALRHMRQAGRGVIVQVSSGLAIRPAPLQAAYCAAKAAVTGFTDSLRTELIAQKSPVSLSVVYLPGVDTPQSGWTRNRTGREQIIPDPLFDPRLCAEAIYTTVLTPQREVWVGRSTVMMAIAQTIAPGFCDNQAAKMADKMQGRPMAYREGNLVASPPGTACINGDGGSRTKSTRREFLTSSQRNLLAIGGAATLLGAGAVTVALVAGTVASLGMTRSIARRLL